MAVRRPLVRVGGQVKQLPAGDVVVGSALRVVLQGAVNSSIPLSSQGTVSLLKADAATSSIPVQS